MTAEEFMEFYSGTKYVRWSDNRAVLNTGMSLDPVNYRRNIFQIAIQHIAHDTVAHVVSDFVYRDVLSGEFRCIYDTDAKITDVLEFPSQWHIHNVTDEDIWQGNEEFPGLYRLTHARCLAVLIADASTGLLKVPPHPDVNDPETLSTHFMVAAPWFFKVANRLRSESVLHFRVAAIVVHYYADRRVTADWIADVFGLNQDKLLEILEKISAVIEENLDEEIQVSRGRADGLASLWRRVRSTNKFIREPR